MILNLQTLTLLLSLPCALLLSACGNKGDLYLVPDEITQQELLRLEDSLNASGALDTTEQESSSAALDAESGADEDEDKDEKDTDKDQNN